MPHDQTKHENDIVSLVLSVVIFYFFSCFLFALIMSLPPTAVAVTQIRGHMEGSPPPPLSTTLRALICIARILQTFLPSSTRVQVVLKKCRNNRKCDDRACRHV